MQNKSFKSIVIVMVLFGSAVLRAAAIKEETPELWLPQYIETEIVKQVLTTQPYHPLTQWLMGKYLQRIVPIDLGGQSAIFAVEITSDGSKIVTYSWDREKRMWDIKTGQLIDMSDGYIPSDLSQDSFDSYVHAKTPDGTKVILANDKVGTIFENTFNTDNLARINTLEGHTGDILAIATTPDGSKVVTGSEDNTAKIWDIETGVCLHTLEGHTGSVAAIAITPDGSTVVTGSDDKTAKIWNIETGALIETLRRHSGRVTAVAITPDGSKIVTGSADGTAKIWNWNIGNLFGALQQLTLKQKSLLELIHKLALKNKKADFTKESATSIKYIEQYRLLPDLIKDLIAEHVIIPKMH